MGSIVLEALGSVLEGPKERSIPMSLDDSPHAAFNLTIDPRQLDELQRVDGRHAVRAACFVAIYGISATGAWQLHAQLSTPWLAWLASLPLYLLAAAALHGISLFTHEGVHGALARHPGWNRWWSCLAAWPVLQNFAAYKVLHLRHHRHLGVAGDPDHYPNYSSWTWAVFLAHWLRLLIGYPVYITMIPILGFRQGSPSDRRWIIAESLAVLGLVAGGVALAWRFDGWQLLLHAWVIPMLLINTMVNIRGMSQHTLLEHAADPIRGTRSILTNRITRFFMCNENYHLEHHLFPRVPWYNLDELHRMLRDELRQRGAPFISSYWAFVVEFAIGSWRRRTGVERVPEERPS